MTYNILWDEDARLSLNDLGRVLHEFVATAGVPSKRGTGHEYKAKGNKLWYRSDTRWYEKLKWGVEHLFGR